MISSDKFAGIFGMVPAGDEESLIAVISEAVRQGIAIVLCKPEDKAPICILNTRDRKRADIATQELARVAGDPLWHRKSHPCGLHHALTVESLGGDSKAVRTKVGAIVRRVAKTYGAMPNIGVELGRSRLVAVDVDTSAEGEAFISEWYRVAGNVARLRAPGMTVQSPGKVNRDGEWVHKDGGHYWFTLPEDADLPSDIGTIRADSGWVVMWSDHQVLVPPSHRPEGAYQLVGPVEPAPEWLISYIQDKVSERVTRQTDRASKLADGTSDIDQWASKLAWDELLVSDGWEATGIPDRCGCLIYTAPGGRANWKSATAHDLGCERYDTSPGHAPLHLWTDAPPEWLIEPVNSGQTTFTRLQYVSWRDHGGDDRATLRAVGINQSPASALEAWVPPPISTAPAREQGQERSVPFSRPVGGTGQDGGSESDSGDGSDDSEDDEEGGIDDEELEDPDTWKSIPLHGRTDEDDEDPPVLMPRSDGAICLLYPGKIHSFHGESESGKSWIIQSEVARIVMSGGSVLFIDFENDWRSVLRRLRSLGVTEEGLKRVDYRNPENKPDFASSNWVGMFTHTYDMAVFDGVTDALGLFGLGSKDNDEVATFLRNFPRSLARRTGAAVVVIDHVTKNAESRGRYALGGQSKMAGLDGAAFVVEVDEPLGRGRVGKLVIKVAKDKPGYIRGIAQGFDANRLSEIATFTMDATGTKITTELCPPGDPFEAPTVDPALLTQILRAIHQAGSEGLTSRRLNQVVRARDEKIREATARLTFDELIMVEEGPRRSKIYRLTDAGREQVGQDGGSDQEQDQDPEQGPEPEVNPDETDK